MATTRETAVPTGGVADADAPAGFAYAEVGSRTVAFVVDAVILAVTSYVIQMLVFGLMGFDYVPWLVWTIMVTSIVALYHLYFWRTRGATPAMQAMKLELADEADGSRLSQPQLITRYLYVGVPLTLAIIFIFNGVGFGLTQSLGGFSVVMGILLFLASVGWLVFLAYTAMGNPKRQGRHDRAARSIVVKRGA